MASDGVTPGLLDRASASSELGSEWRRLTRNATLIAIITSPGPFFWFHSGLGWGIVWSLVAIFFTVIAFRGLVDRVPGRSFWGIAARRLRGDRVTEDFQRRTKGGHMTATELRQRFALFGTGLRARIVGFE